MMKGRPAIYATFSSYDEVAYHSGLERADTLEALRKLDHQFGRIERAWSAHCARTRSWPPTTVRPRARRSSSERLRLDELVRQSLEAGDVTALTSGDENDATVGNAFGEATGREPKQNHAKNDVSGEEVVVLASGNLGLVYLMDEPRRMTRGDRRAAPAPAVLARRAPARRLAAGALCRARPGGAVQERHPLPRRRGVVEGEIRSRRSRPMRHGISCARTASGTSPTSWSARSTTRISTRAAPFEELISFHGAWAARRPSRSCSTPGASASPTSRSSVPR